MLRTLGAKISCGHALMAALLAVAVLATLYQVDRVMETSSRIRDLREPTARKGLRMLNSINESNSALRGWAILKDPSLNAERGRIWREKIYPDMEEITRLSKDWTLPENKVRLVEISRRLGELEEAQNQIAEIAHTSRNRPAKHLFNQKVRPRFKVIDDAIAEMLTIEQIQETTGDRKRLLGQVAQFSGDVGSLAGDIRTYLLSGDVNRHDSIGDSQKRVREQVASLLSQRSLLTREQLDALTRAHGSWIELEPLVAQVIELRSGNQWDQAAFLLSTNTLPKSQELQTLLDTMVNSQRNLMIYDLERNKSQLVILRSFEWGLFALGLVTCFVLALAVSRSVIHPIQNAVVVAKDVAAGVYDRRVNISGSTEAQTLSAALSAMSDSLHAAAQNNARHNWIQSGRQALSDEVCGNADCETIAHAILNQLAAYLNCQAGVFYVTKDDQTLDQIASFGIKQHPQPKFSIDFDGRYAGQAVLEKVPIVLKDIANGDSYDDSDIGIARPAYIAIKPLLYNGVATAVLELGAAAPFTEEQIELLDQVSETAAIAIDSAQIRQQNIANELRIRAILDTIVDPVITISEDGLIQSFNQAAERLFGYSEEDVLGKNVTILMPSPYRETHDESLKQYVSTRQANIIGTSRELVAMKRDGTIFPVMLSVSQTFAYRKGVSLLFTGVIRDLTQQKQHEEQMRKLSAAVEQSPISIAITDVSGVIEFVNSRFTEATGYTEAEVIGQDARILSSGDTPRETYTDMWNALKDGKVWQGEFRNAKKNGDLFWELATIAPIRNEQAEVTHYVALKEDVTQRKITEADLLKQTAKAREMALQAEAANQVKSEFLANMSHELRTPMTAILGFADTLLANVDDPGDVESALTIKRNGEYLINLINDILDLSKVESGKMDTEQIDCSPCQLIDEIAELMRVRADAKGLQLDVHYDGPIPETICTDPTRMRQVIINIVGNAIKFTESGSVQIAVRLLNESEMEPKLQIDVVDTGIGISEENIAKLFDPFTQVDNSVTRKFGGTGLGLSISKRLADLLGGELSVSSAPECGSSFSITLPTGSLDNVRLVHGISASIANTQNEPVAHLDSSSLHGTQILLAEDGPDNQRLISFVLKKSGAKVTLAENGKIAFDLATIAQKEGRPFDVILMDMQMPVLDGYSATRQLRQAGYDGPIIALTANAMSHDRKKCLDAGCDKYATKPIVREDLIELVASYCEQVTL